MRPMRHRRWTRPRSFWAYSAVEEYAYMDEAGFFGELSLVLFWGLGDW